VDGPGSSRDGWEILLGIAQQLGDDWGWRSFDDVWSDIRKNVPTHADVDVEAIAQDLPPQTPQFETGFETAKLEGAFAGPGAIFPKGFRQGSPFQTGQNWPLSWELRQFEARQRPGQVPAAPGAAVDVPAPPSHDGSSPPADDTLMLYAGRMIYDEGSMVSKSAALRGISKKAFVEMNDVDVKRLGLADGDEVVVNGGGVKFNARLVIADIAEGTAFVPYDQDGMKAAQLMSGGNRRVIVVKA
jgi:predicted molibdopterin-dependent oxidoreductase YjgC